MSPPADRGAHAPPRRDALVVLGVALAARLAVALWAASRFPPAADGTYYQRIAERISMGLGYTWLWPDGVVTYAAHYPVGYPATMGALYALVGPRPAAAMLLNAALGALAALAVHRLAARAASRRNALIAGLLVALHPGLVAYTPALMTEGVTAALVTIAAAIAAWARGDAKRPLLGVAGMGLVIGAATLVRPQSILFAPAFAILAACGGAAPAARGARAARALAFAAAATLAALAVCAPWTARNCVRMKSCALVSVNGGWNLLIGADDASTGAWSPIKVPEACRTVYDEAQKDACFGREARRYIAAHPLRWIALAPRKLAATFDYAGAAGWYLHESNPQAFSARAKIALGAVETLYERIVLLLALVAALRIGPRTKARYAVTALGLAFALTLHAWLAYLAFALLGLLSGRALFRGPMLMSAATLTVLSTLGVHAAFFGAGRYSLLVFPLLSGAAALAFQPRIPNSTT